MNSNKIVDIRLLLLASGESTRFNKKREPKHLIDLDNIPVFIWTLSTLLSLKYICEITIVTNSKYLQLTKEKLSLIKSKKFLDHITITTGGDTRMGSFFKGMEIQESICPFNEETLIGLIDANRPLVNINLYEQLINKALKNGSSCPTRDIVNGIAKVKNKKIVSIPNKSEFQEFYTPEFIKYGILNSPVNSSSRFKSLVEYSLNVGVNPETIECDESICKLTYPEDLPYIENLIRTNKIVSNYSDIVN